MNAEKLMKIMGHILFWSYAAVNMLYVFRAHIWEFGPEIAGEYSIYSSKNFFIAYHIWGAILAGICSFTLWKKNTRLFMIALFLFLVVMFYPYFTSSPVDRAKARQKEQVETPKNAPPTNLDGKESEQ